MFAVPDFSASGASLLVRGRRSMRACHYADFEKSRLPRGPIQLDEGIQRLRD